MQCKPNENARAIEHLGHQGFEAFSPSCRVIRRVGTVRRPVDEPMFPGYAFVRLSPSRDDWSVLRSTRGVRQLVRFGGVAPRVPESLIDRLRTLDGTPVDTPAERLQAGDRVRVLEGPFAGMNAVFLEKDGMLRAALLIDCMQRQVRVVVASDALAPAV